jgi:hypothetical protein
VVFFRQKHLLVGASSLCYLLFHRADDAAESIFCEVVDTVKSTNRNRLKTQL